MGGLWVDNENQATNLPGVYAAGECEYQYHGANRLGANSLVSCIYGGGIAGSAAVRYARNLESGCENTSPAVYERERVRQQDISDALLNQHTGTENPLAIWRELGNMLLLAKVITLGAIARNETRGAHYKPEFPERDDANWLKTTIASWHAGKIKLEYEAVDTSLLPLRERKYTAAK